MPSGVFQNQNKQGAGNIFGNIFGNKGGQGNAPVGPQFPVADRSFRQDAENLQASVFPSLTQAAPQALDTGLGTLQQILGMQGATDPALLNKQLAGISQGTQGNQDALQGQLARLGLQNSGVGQALGGAIGQSGVAQRSQAVAQDNALAEERKRSDLVNLLLPLLIQPGQQANSNLFGLASTPDSPSDFESLLGGLAGGATSYLTGGLF